MILEVFEIEGSFEDKYKYWKLFKKYHYLTDDLPKSSRCFVGYLDGNLAAFISFYVFPNGSVRKFMASSRHVVFPDYQNIGIGTRMIEFVAEYLKREGFKPYIKSTLYKLKNYIQSDIGETKWLNMGIQTRKWSDAYKNYKNDLPKGVNPATYKLPFKVYDHKKINQDGSIINPSNCGDHSYHWINRSSISARYVGYEWFKKEHVLIIMEPPLTKNNKSLYDEILDNLSKSYYYEVYNGTTENGSKEQEYTDTKQLDSYALYDTKGIRNKVYKGINYDKYEKIIYIYDNRHKKLKKFLENDIDYSKLIEYRLTKDTIEVDIIDV